MDDERLEMSIAKELSAQRAQEKAKPILDRFNKSKRKVSDRFNEHVENMAFYENRQFSLSKYKIARPWVVRMRTPYAGVAIDTRVSSLIASDYTGTLIPMKAEDGETVKALDAFKDDEWERMNLNQKINECVKTSAIVREAYLHILWKEEENYDVVEPGDVEIEKKGHIDAYAIDMPSSVYIDPYALCFEEARYISLVTRGTRTELMENYPEYKEYLSGINTRFSPQDRGEVYMGEEYSNEQTDVLTIITHYEKVKGIVRKSIVIEDILVAQDDLDGLRDIPIAQMRWKRLAGSPYGSSLMDELIDIQKAINAIESAVTNTAISYSSPSYGVRKGSGINPKEIAIAGGAPGMVVSVEGPIQDAIQPLKLPTLDNAIINVKQDFVNVVTQIAGISNPFLGSVGTAGNTSGGTKMALDRARIIEGDVLHNIESFVEQITNIVIQYITAKYAGETVPSRQVNRSTGEVAFKESQIPAEAEDVKYSFFINLSTKTSFSKEREREQLLELYQMDNQYKAKTKLLNQLDILESYDLSNKDVLVDRFKKLMAKSDEQTAQLIVQLTQTSTQLGVNPEMVQKAITELLGDSEETPIYDQLMQQMKQMAQQQAQLKQETLQQTTADLEANGVPAQMMQAMQGQMGGQQGGGQQMM